MALHESIVHALLSLQLSGVPPVQTPAWQISVPLQTSPSGQGVPGAGMFTQPVCGSQPSLVQMLLSLQSSGVPATHAPSTLQVSAPLHTSASGQALPAGSWLQVPPPAQV